MVPRVFGHPVNDNVSCKSLVLQIITSTSCHFAPTLLCIPLLGSPSYSLYFKFLFLVSPILTLYTFTHRSFTHRWETFYARSQLIASLYQPRYTSTSRFNLWPTLTLQRKNIVPVWKSACFDWLIVIIFLIILNNVE